MKLSAGGVERALPKLCLERTNQCPSIVAELFHQHAHDWTLAQLGIEIDAPDDFSAQRVDLIAMYPQRLARQALVEKPDQERLEHVKHSLARTQISGLNPPTVRPVVRIQVVRL